MVREMVLWRARKDCTAARQAGNRRKNAEQAEAKSAASTGALHRKRTAAEAAEAKLASSASGALQRKRMAAVLAASGGGGAAAAAGALGGGGRGGVSAGGGRGSGAGGGGAGAGAVMTNKGGSAGVGVQGVTMRSIRAKFLKDISHVRVGIGDRDMDLLVVWIFLVLRMIEWLVFGSLTFIRKNMTLLMVINTHACRKYLVHRNLLNRLTPPAPLPGPYASLHVCAKSFFFSSQLHRSSLVWCERAAPPLLLAGDSSEGDGSGVGVGTKGSLWRDCLVIVRNLTLLNYGRGGVGVVSSTAESQGDEPIGKYGCFVKLLRPAGFVRYHATIGEWGDLKTA